MSRLAGVIDGVIGVDTHRDTLAAAVTDMVGGLLAQTSVPMTVELQRCDATHGGGEEQKVAALPSHGSGLTHVARAAAHVHDRWAAAAGQQF